MPELAVRQVYERMDPADKSGVKRQMVIAFTVATMGPFERPYPIESFNLDMATREAAVEFERKGFGKITVKPLA